MKEFKINEYITVKLETFEKDKGKSKTYIHVNGKRFSQCKYLMLNIPIDDVKYQDEIDSIDEAADSLGWTYDGQEGVEYEIDSETEFWGHCSNLQAWYENDYDTRLLHSNLSFPLLQRLTTVGDPLAKRVLKREIVERFESAYPTVVGCIVSERLLRFLNEEERELLIKENFHSVLYAMKEFPYQLHVVLDIFYFLIDKSKGTDLLRDNFHVFLGTIDKLNVYNQYHAFSFLIESIKTKTLQDNMSLIDTQFLRLLSNIDDLQDFNIPGMMGDGFSNVLKVVKITGLKKKYLLAFLNSFESIPDEDRYSTLWNLRELAKTAGCLEDNFLVFLEMLDKIYSREAYEAFYYLILSIEGTEALKKNLSQIESRFLLLLKDAHGKRFSDIYSLFSWLLKIAKITGLIKNHFPAILESIERLSKWDKFTVLKILFEEIEGTDLANEPAYKRLKEKNPPGWEGSI